MVQRISLIIPTLNEEEHILDTLASCQDPLLKEVIVVDGGSSDRTRELAERSGTHLIQAGRGRAIQMNAGAHQARGEILLFLHADTRLPERFGANILETLAQRQTAAGAFRLKISHRGSLYRWIETAVSVRSRLLGMPYGDQGLFLTRGAFEHSGGFPAEPILEDLILVRQLRKQGRVRISPLAVLTSARRWQRAGPWKVTVVNQLVISAYLLGVKPSTIAGWHRRLAGGR